MAAIFQAPPTIHTGFGAIEALGTEAAKLGECALIVTGKGAMRAQGHLETAMDLLAKAGLVATVYEGVGHDPDVATVDAIRGAIRSARADVVIGLGGGSAIDAAKAAAGLAPLEEPTAAFLAGATIPPSTLPVIAAPSTHGTGTEATRVAVLSDPAAKTKKGIRHDSWLPRVALVDPALALGTPARITAACGMDALTQAIESLLSRHATDLTQALSLHAIELLWTGLPRAFANGADREARTLCANGSLMAGMALHNARLGLIHGLAHPLGARHGLIHGEVCGALLPYVLAFNSDFAGLDWTRLELQLGGDPVDRVIELLNQLGLPVGLSHAGIGEEDLEILAEETLPSGSTKANPRDVQREDVLRLLREACGL